MPDTSRSLRGLQRCAPLALPFLPALGCAQAFTLERLLDTERNAPPPPVAWPDDRLGPKGSSLRPAELLRMAPGEPAELAVRMGVEDLLRTRLP